jgi:hypothetical protein
MRWTVRLGLITRRSQVQILPPLLAKALLARGFCFLGRPRYRSRGTPVVLKGRAETADACSIPAASTPAIAAQLQHLNRASPDPATLVRCGQRAPRRARPRAGRPQSHRCRAESCRSANGPGAAGAGATSRPLSRRKRFAKPCRSWFLHTRRRAGYRPHRVRKLVRGSRCASGSFSFRSLAAGRGGLLALGIRVSRGPESVRACVVAGTASSLEGVRDPAPATRARGSSASFGSAKADPCRSGAVRCAQSRSPANRLDEPRS